MKVKARLAHRDIKPDNIMLSDEGNSYLWADFGITILVPIEDKDMI